jgi:hypothetical protein
LSRPSDPGHMIGPGVRLQSFPLSGLVRNTGGR